MTNRYRDLIADLCASEAWGDAALKSGFIEGAIEYYEDAYEAALSLGNKLFLAEVDDTAAWADLNRIEQKWGAALKAFAKGISQHAKPKSEGTA